MPSKDYTIELLGLKGFVVKNLEETEENIYVDIEKERMPHTCPKYQGVTERIHDYRIQRIRHITVGNKTVILKYRKRRYVCPCCNSRFYEQNGFVPKGYRLSHALIHLILRSFNQMCTYTEVAHRYGISVTTVIRYYDTLNFDRQTLPSAIGIDEFKGNLEGEKYQTIITDVKHRKIVGFTRSRNSEELDTELLRYKNYRDVKLVVMDMSNIYKALVKRMFKNAEIVVDKYHVIRLAGQALEMVRKEGQKAFAEEHRRKIKAKKRLLLKKYEYLSEYEKQELSILFEQIPRLGKAYYLKMEYDKIFDSEDEIEAKKRISDWLLDAQILNYPEFNMCISAMTNWSHEIVNIFRYKLTNGYTEGCNNKTKVLKRISYGLRNYERFVKRRKQLQQGI